MGQIELVTTDAEQPYHMRIRNEGNHTISWRTENYFREDDALDALRELPGADTFYLSHDLGPVTAHLSGQAFLVHEVDERAEAVPVEDVPDAVYDGPDDPAGLGTPHNHLSREFKPRGECQYCDWLQRNDWDDGDPPPLNVR